MPSKKKNPLAVIVQGNPKYLNEPSVAIVAQNFYNSIKSRLEAKGFEVILDAGEPYTLPPSEAQVWLGHSRGQDRLDYAPEHIQTIYLKTKMPHNGLHPDHYELHEEDEIALSKLQPKIQGATFKKLPK